MSQLGITQLDSLLNFTKLHLLVLTPQFKLVGHYPDHRSFLGWDEVDLETFSFEENFLKPNHLDITLFLGHFQPKDHLVKNYYWRDADQQISGPYETYIRLKKQAEQLKLIMAFVKIVEYPNKIEISPDQKYKLFLAEPLPGLLHNLFGPLGTLSGRLELLKSKNSQLKDLDELLKMTHFIQSSLKNLGYKLVHEKQPAAVEIDLNQFMREELQFLTSDLFFKHQVKKSVKFLKESKKFLGIYSSLSGILSEFYYFFRRFVFEDQEYQLQAEIFHDQENIGFYLNFLGDFHIPADLNLHFPFDLEGSASQIIQQKIEGLDLAFLGHCLRENDGYLEISGKKEMMKIRLLLPVTPA
ncbi:MAG: hypothetical protein A2Y94_03230 [Caldithrix sp. RBG_13_44_9]|nr:MAG: hypothetical protein A2Y94_03230 [Caldithrix sp. RBG_13_44_9]